MDLWGDVWFYISALGFLGSGVLFLYLFGQYRSAVEEADEGDAVSPPLDLSSRGALPAKPAVVELTPAPVAAPIVPLPKTKAAPAVSLMVAVAPSEGKEQQPSKADVVPATPLPAAAPEPRRSDGIDPAVACWQSIKSQMEKFDESIAALKALSAQQAVQGQLVLKRLSELAEASKAEPAPARQLGGLPPAAAEPEPPAVLPVAQKAPAVEKPESAPPALVLPASAQEAEAQADLAAAVGLKSPPPEPAAPASEPPVQPSQPRKGPVWPV